MQPPRVSKTAANHVAYEDTSRRTNGTLASDFDFLIWRNWCLPGVMLRVGGLMGRMMDHQSVALERMIDDLARIYFGSCAWIQRR